jgi:hypothetical protein
MQALARPVPKLLPSLSTLPPKLLPKLLPSPSLSPIATRKLEPAKPA